MVDQVPRHIQRLGWHHRQTAGYYLHLTGKPQRTVTSTRPARRSLETNRVERGR